MSDNRTRYNPKRKFDDNCDMKYRDDIADKVKYGGSPLHKKNPGNYGLTPPIQPRPHKTLCEGVNINSPEDATRLLRLGVDKGLVSEQKRGNFPQNIWAVAEGGIPMEAQLDNQETGSYHGYPLSEGDPFREEILGKWQ